MSNSTVTTLDFAADLLADGKISRAEYHVLALGLQKTPENIVSWFESVVDQHCAVFHNCARDETKNLTKCELIAIASLLVGANDAALTRLANKIYSTIYA